MSAVSGTQEIEQHCTQLIAPPSRQTASPTLKELTEKITNGTDEEKIDALKSVIRMHLNGEPIDRLLMTIIRFVLPSNDKKLKKLGLYYLENINKYQANGQLREELILVCSHLRNDLLHPNEYVRGVTLRFVCKLKDAELLGPLIDPICQNLEHRHSYVRRNAVLAVFSVYTEHPSLIPDAPEMVENFLNAETEMSSKRNAFLMLFSCDQDRAVRYLRSIMRGNIHTIGDTFQLSILNLLRKMVRNNPKEKGKYLRVITTLIESPSPAVLYQCAGTLVSLTTSQAAIKVAASCYIKLLSTNSDSNVKLIVLDRLNELRAKYPSVMESIVAELLRVLKLSTDLDIKKKVLQLIMDLVNDRNVLSVLDVLRSEAQKSQEVDIEYAKANEVEYRKVLVLAVHKLIPNHPKQVGIVQGFVPMLRDNSGFEVALLMREALALCASHKLPLRSDLLNKLINELPLISDPRVKRAVVWMSGEYANTESEIRAVVDVFLSEQSTADETTAAQPEAPQTKTQIGKDGSYRTYQVDTTSSVPRAKSNIDTLIGFGNFYLASVLATTYVKCIAKLRELGADTKKISATVLLSLATMLRKYASKMDQDSLEHIQRCVKIILTKKGEDILLAESANAFEEILKERTKREKQVSAEEEKKRTQVSCDSVLSLSILHAKEPDAEFFDDEETITDKATKNGTSELSRVIQLTGFSDPVYAEAKITIQQFDVLLDVLLVNQTGDTLTNLTLELATVGDLRLCERPVSYTMAPYAQQRVKANIKVSSTETGIIFGNIVYDAHQQSQCVILNDVNIDIMDYISPAVCEETAFRAMWFEFEWENKIPVKTNVHDSLKDYLHELCKVTHMNCLTSESALGDVFLSANLYARSAFGEDALASVSVERAAEGIEGFVRIRSKTQGIALSLGDRITREQKKHIM